MRALFAVFGFLAGVTMTLLFLLTASRHAVVPVLGLAFIATVIVLLVAAGVPEPRSDP